MLRKKVAENLKNWKDAAIKRKILKNSEDWEIFTQPDQESRTASRLRDQVRRLPELLVYIEDSKNLLRSWLTEQLWQCLRFSSSSHYFEFKKA